MTNNVDMLEDEIPTLVLFTNQTVSWAWPLILNFGTCYFLAVSLATVSFCILWCGLHQTEADFLARITIPPKRYLLLAPKLSKLHHRLLALTRVHLFVFFSRSTKFPISPISVLNELNTVFLTHSTKETKNTQNAGRCKSDEIHNDSSSQAL